MSGTPPPPLAVRAMEQGTAQIVRRLEIYETDGEALWEFPGSDSRLTGGSVTLDYSRDERRMIDVTLRNDDNALRINPYGGFWYDKVLKPYRGVRYRNMALPRIVIVEENTANSSFALRQALLAIGFNKVDIKLAVTKFEEVIDYDIIVGLKQTAALIKTDLYKRAYNSGRSVITTTVSADSSILPFVISTTAGTSTTWGATPVTTDVPVAMNWASHAATGGNASGVLITAVNETATVVGTWRHSTTNALFYTAILAQNNVGGKWFHYSPRDVGSSDAKKLWRAAIDWMRGYGSEVVWETQLGEFVIDTINTDHFPYHAKVSGRDYTKRCLNSKITKATSWEEGESGRNIIAALAANSGITKTKIPVFELAIPQRLDYAAGISRWQVMKDIANSFSHDLYFDSQGYLVMVPFQDPVSSPAIHVFQTGKEAGNIVRYSRSVNDSELYNHIVITSETNSDALPFFGEALNTEPGSPTSIKRIGDRPYFWSSAALASDDACIDLARAWLKIYALESYDLSADTITYPWLDVGNVVEFKEPNRLSTDPTRFLLSSLTIPLELGPMSGAMRRLSIVTDTGIEEPDWPTDSPEQNPDPNPEDPVEPEGPPIPTGGLFPSESLYPSETLYPRDS